GERLALHRNIIAEFNRGVFVRARAPDLSIRNEATPNFSPVHQWSMVIDSDIRQRNALFDLGSLAGIRRLQIALCKGDLAEPDDGETKSEWLKRDCIHIVAVTLPRFSILRYQIIRSCPNPLRDSATTRFSVVGGGTISVAERNCRSRSLLIVMSSEVETARCETLSSVAGFLDFARNDKNGGGSATTRSH